MSALDELKTIVATRTRRLVIWTGAGLSASAGIPTWQALQRRLETRLDEKLRELDIPDGQRETRVKAIKQEENPWVAFQRLQVELGFTSYREAIRDALSKSASATVPPAYRSLWGLRPSGLINLNLDRLATRAFTEAGYKGLIEFKGKDVGGHAHTLNSPRQFVCNLHGVEDDVDSWIFTHDSLKSLAEMESYQHYMTALLASTTVLFLGISADDVAVGGHLERIERYGLRTNPHYWITDRRDAAGDLWAEKNNVRVIRYKPSSVEHPELQGILLDLEAHVQPEAEPSPPVALTLPLGSPAISSVADLVGKDPEQIRSELNSFASSLLASRSEDDIRKYEEFSKAYDRAIHAAWYTSTDSGENKFLGYELVEEVARGAFGIVFRAIDSNGKSFAIKLLHAEIRKKRDLLDAFRRGVRSLGILQSYSLAGVVGYVDASEIPATLIMEWVDGPNLNEVVKSNTLDEWNQIIEIAYQLTSVVSSAHALPERVLHRDIRPPNMIVSNYWHGEDIELKVLDFDLSWHRGSVEKSVIFGSQLSGYLAPEQVQRKNGVSTQHASVDSYGIGMTLFYMVSARDPAPGEHAHSTWTSTLSSAVQRPRGHSWKSLPQRVCRLIRSATQEEQKKRWDVIQLRSELSLLRQTHHDPTGIESVEMIAEELAARTPMLSQYDWDPEAFSIVKNFGTGLVVTVRGDESSRDVRLGIRRVAGEADNRGRLGDAIAKARDNVRDVLQEAGWSVSATVGKGSLEVEASVSSDEVVKDFPRYVESLRKALERTQFQ